MVAVSPYLFFGGYGMSPLPLVDAILRFYKMRFNTSPSPMQAAPGRGVITSSLSPLQAVSGGGGVRFMLSPVEVVLLYDHLFNETNFCYAPGPRYRRHPVEAFFFVMSVVPAAGGFTFRPAAPAAV